MANMTEITGDFNFPNLSNVASIEPPLISARLIGDDVVVRIFFLSSGTLTMDPTVTLESTGEGQITYETEAEAEPQNPNTLWYAEFTMTDMTEVSISVLDKRKPNQTSRGTTTTVQPGTGNTIDN